MWFCKCDCGKELVLDGVKMRKGYLTSCSDCRKLNNHGVLKFEEINNDPDSDFIKVPLTQNYFYIIDKEDYEIVKDYKWRILKGKTNIYAIAHFKNDKNGYLYMHRLIMNFPEELIDHKNRNGLDNRRENLRIANKSLNAVNSPKHPRNMKSSIYKGVVPQKKKGIIKWCANIKVNNKNYFLGTFRTEKMAAIIYNIWAKKVHGEFAWLNQIK